MIVGIPGTLGPVPNARQKTTDPFKAPQPLGDEGFLQAPIGLDRHRAWRRRKAPFGVNRDFPHGGAGLLRLAVSGLMTDGPAGISREQHR